MHSCLTSQATCSISIPDNSETTLAVSSAAHHPRMLFLTPELALSCFPHKNHLHPERDYVRPGGWLPFGPEQPDLARRTVEKCKSIIYH